MKLLLSGAALALLCSSAQASYVLDQEFFYAQGTQGASQGNYIAGGFYSDIVYSQQVTAGISGFIGRIEFYHLDLGDASGEMELFISTASGPASSPFAYSELVDVSVLGDGWFGIDVSASGLSFQAGEQFTIGIAATGNGFARFRASRLPSPEYAGGDLWYQGSSFGPNPVLRNNDLFFRTYLTPAPASLAVLGLGCVAVRRRR